MKNIQKLRLIKSRLRLKFMMMDYYVVTGTGVEKMIGYTNIDTEKGFAFLPEILKRKGYY